MVRQAAALIAFLVLAPSGPGLAEDVRVVAEGPSGGFVGLEEGAARFCENIADQAAEARMRRQAEALRRLEGEIEARIAELEAKRAETEEWLARRERFLAMAEDGLVSIYAQMRPDAASAQLAIMNEVAAAAILTKLAPREASAILDEMDAQKAARLASIMVGIGARDT
jgi:flagellar motility protein MotE (MotC chaperone)